MDNLENRVGERRHPKLKYEARPSESNNSQYVDIWCFLKPGETP